MCLREFAARRILSDFFFKGRSQAEPCTTSLFLVWIRRSACFLAKISNVRVGIVYRLAYIARSAANEHLFEGLAFSVPKMWDIFVLAYRRERTFLPAFLGLYGVQQVDFQTP